MHWIDWSIIGGYLVVVTLIGIWFTRRASGSVEQYFVAGRNLPWWMAGTSLVATSFAADTPLFVAGLIATMGISGNWLWWNKAIGWALGIAFFSRLWRRSGVITDAEFIELRYDGKPAAILRAFRAIYMSVFVSTITLAWVMLAMQKIVQATIAKPNWAFQFQQFIEHSLNFEAGAIDVWKWTILIGLFLLATFYTALAGFWGIVATDLLQFLIASIGSILFAVIALQSVGGMTELQSKLVTEYGPERVRHMLDFLPAIDSPWMTPTAFVVFLSVVWWGDCDGFAAQRMFSTRTERDSVLSAAWYSIAHFVLRPWPWIVVGLVAVVYYPNLEDPESAYPMLMMEVLPIGIKGMLVASLLAAFMSTVDTHLNWSASYFVTDIYKRFLCPNAEEANCVKISRTSVIVFASLAVFFACVMTSIKEAVVVLFGLQAGVNLVVMLRWFWWRINAWSEISAMLASLATTIALQLLRVFYELELSDSQKILTPIMVSTPIWVIFTLLTKPVDSNILRSFYSKIRPPITFWKPVATQFAEMPRKERLSYVLGLWGLILGCLYSLMFSLGKLVLLQMSEAAVWGGICLTLVIFLMSWMEREPLLTSLPSSDSHQEDN